MPLWGRGRHQDLWAQRHSNSHFGTQNNRHSFDTKQRKPLILSASGPQEIDDESSTSDHFKLPPLKYGNARTPPYRRSTSLPMDDFSFLLEKPLKQEPTSVVSPSEGLWSWIPHVAQSADDSTVSHRVKEVFVFAEQFVSNFYSDRPQTLPTSAESIDTVNRSRLLSTPQLRNYLVEADYQTTLIKHVLMSLLLDLISFDTETGDGSLLPKHFQNYTMIAAARSRSTSSTDSSTLHIQPALSAYRVLSAYIRSDIEHDLNYMNERNKAAQSIVTMFGPAFEQWSNENRSQADWTTSLIHLLERASSLGIFLFSQPSVYFFDWEMTDRDQTARLLPIWPRMLKVFDEEARLKDISDHMIVMRCGRVFKKSE